MTRINALYANVGGRGLDAVAFCDACLKDLDVTWTVDAGSLERLKAIEGPCVVVANHPLGGREALVLHCLLGQVRQDYRIVANHYLGGLWETRSKLILVDPYETRESAKANVLALRDCLRFMQQGGLLGLFPAGEVSYWQADEGRVADKPWASQSVRMILKSKATVVPLRFVGVNGALFNAVARWATPWKAGLLAQQLAYGPTRHVEAILGRPIPFTDLPFQDDPSRLAAWLREQVYALPTPATGKVTP